MNLIVAQILAIAFSISLIDFKKELESYWILEEPSLRRVIDDDLEKINKEQLWQCVTSLLQVSKIVTRSQASIERDKLTLIVFFFAKFINVLEIQQR